MASKETQNEKSLLLAMLLFIGAGALILSYLWLEDSKLKTAEMEVPSVLKSEQYEKSVNRHLMLTNEKMKLESQRAYLENARILSNGIRSTPAQHAYSNEEGLNLNGDRRAEELANELGRGVRREEAMSPHDIVQKELFNEQQMQEYTEAYKEEYARQFIENARRGGYKVILSEDLSRVISVTPIRSPSQNQNLNLDLTPGSGSIH